MSLSFRGFAGNSELRSSGSVICSGSSNGAVTCGSDAVESLRLIAPIRWTHPDMAAWNFRKRVTSRPVSGSEKKFDARTDKKRGDNPNNAILVPEAMPRYLGNVLDAAKSEENNL